MTDFERAYAKLNLALHVRRRRGDGYHDLETIFAFVDVGDTLRVAPCDRIKLDIGGPFAAGLSAADDNLVVRAARLLADRHGVRQGAALHLDKALPVASVIGGGSADAAATLRLLRRFWKLGDVALEPVAAELGADVPACLASRAARGEGVGDRLTFADAGDIAGRAVVLVNPLRLVATAAVFAAWDGVDRGALAGGPVWAAALAGRNDLEAPAIAICPAIADVLALLRSAPGVELARMSGSGATCFGIFSDCVAGTAAASAIGNRHRDWWVAMGALR